MTQKKQKFQTILISTVLVVLILIAFEPLRHNDFINYYDDDVYVTANRHIQSGITAESVAWAFTSGYAANWHPLTWLSHMMDIELFGLSPLGHHLHNLALHTASTILLFLLLQSMTGAVWRSAFVAMAFGLHPLHVESVAWVAERKDVLCVLFWMLTIAAYLYYAKRGGTARYLLVALCFALGLMAKPMLVTLPIVLLILDFWPLGRVQKKDAAKRRRQLSLDNADGKNYRPASISRLMVEKIPLFILTLASCIITYQVQQSGGCIAKAELFPWMPRISNALVSYVGYLGKIFWPQDLAVLYPYPIHGWPLWKPMVSFFLLMLGSVFVFYRFPKQPYLVTGWFWYGVMLVPVIGLVQVGFHSMTDRYTYLPSIGIFIMLSWAAVQFSAKWRYRKVVLGILSGLVAIAMTAGTRAQLAYWKDNISLFEHTLATTQNNYMIHNNLATTLERQGRLDEAAEHAQKALQIWPDFPDANINMAVILMKRNQFDKAMEHLQKSLKIRPNNNTAYFNMGIIFETQERFDEAIQAYEQAARFDRNDSDAFNHLGVLKGNKGLRDEAAECFRQSIRSNPDNAEAHRNLGFILQMQGRIEESIRNFQMALQADPHNDISCWYVAISLQQAGRFQEAVDAYHYLLQLKPGSVKALNNLAWVLATTPDTQIRNPAEAVQLAQKACQLTSFKNAGLLDTLAAAYASANQFKEAIETAQKAMELAETTRQTDIAEEIFKRLQLYQTGKAFYYEPSPQEQKPDSQPPPP